MPRLTAQLFERDPEREGYLGEATRVLKEADGRAIPDVARQTSLNHLQHMLSFEGSASFDGWVGDIAETFASGYVLAESEEWSLDGSVARDLIEASIRALNQARLPVGSVAITPHDASRWLSLVLWGLNSDIAEWTPVNDYVRAQGAWDRLEWVLPSLLMVGERVGKVRTEEVAAWRAANGTAWRDGIFLSLLGQLGLFTPEAGGRTFGDEHRPLSGLLYEVDPEAYQRTAAQLMQATAPAVPVVPRQIYFSIHFSLSAPMLDEKLGRRYRKLLSDAFEIGYVLCLSEAWEELDPKRLGALIDEGLKQVITKGDSRDLELLLRDPEYRIRTVALGIAGGMFYFTALAEYLDDQGAFLRIGGLGEMVIGRVLDSSRVKKRHRDSVEHYILIAFRLGVAIGLLDQLGEIGEEAPAQLPP
jgi:hypothetical protein